MRYFIYLSYDGSAYCGWQRQPDAPTVQQTLEEALGTLLRRPVAVTGAGRTDTGVHASRYVAHFDCGEEIGPVARTCYRLNSILPSDIAVHDLRRVADDAHARFDALSREYTYYIRRSKHPFDRNFSWQYGVELDMERMNEAAARLSDYRDFTTFAKLNSANKTNICRISSARWTREGERLVFRIRADRFLRNMVRAIVAALVDVGRGKINPERFAELIELRDLSLARGSAPARGLFLSDVESGAEIEYDNH